MSQVNRGLYNALIRRGIDDRDLHRRALEQVRDPALQMLLFENLQTLDALIAELQNQVRDDGGAPAEHGTVAGNLRYLAASLSMPFSSHRDSAWVHCLARHECESLHSFERRLERSPGDKGGVLARHLSRLYGMHKDMHCLAGTTHG